MSDQMKLYLRHVVIESFNSQRVSTFFSHPVLNFPAKSFKLYQSVKNIYFSEACSRRVNLSPNFCPSLLTLLVCVTPRCQNCHYSIKGTNRTMSTQRQRFDRIMLIWNCVNILIILGYINKFMLIQKELIDMPIIIIE